MTVKRIPKFVWKEYLDEKLCRFQKHKVGKGLDSGEHSKSATKSDYFKLQGLNYISKPMVAGLDSKYV